MAAGLSKAVMCTGGRADGSGQAGGRDKGLTWVRRQALEWLHKRGRSYSDLKPDNVRVLMGQQPGTFSHVTLPDLGGSVQFKGESLMGGALLIWGCVRLPAALFCHDKLLPASLAAS